MQIKIANETKQNDVISGQNNIKNKFNNGYHIKSIQRGTSPSMEVESFTAAERSANYQRKVASFSPINVDKSILVYNTPEHEDTNRFPFIYYYFSTSSRGTHEKLDIELKSDGIYTTQNKRDLTGFAKLEYHQYALSWQVIEFY